MTKENEDYDPTNQDIEDMIIKSGATDEEDFQNKVLKNWNLIKCKRCGKKFNLLNAIFEDGDPIHKSCL